MPDALHPRGPQPGPPSPFAVVRPGALWRGSRPDSDQLALLADLGARLWVDLRAEALPSEGEAKAHAAGLDYFRIPVVDNTAPTFGQVAQFLGVVGRGGGVTFAACHAGCGRSGYMAACYLMATGGYTLAEVIAWNQQFAPHVLGIKLTRAFTSVQLHGLRDWAVANAVPLGE